MKFIILILSLLTFLVNLILILHYQASLLSYNIFIFLNWFNYLNISYVIGIDGLSLIFISLTNFLFPICILVSWANPMLKKKQFFMTLFLTQFFLVNFFAVLDLFVFFLFFECILIPMYLLIGIWGSNLRKTYASYQLFFFTTVGSIFMLASLISLFKNFGTFDFNTIEIKNNFYNVLTLKEKILIFSFIFLTFSVKIPIVPFHFWLPEAHVEAPTSGSIILAGILLKLGAYGLIRFLYPLFLDSIIYLNPILWTICIYSVFYISFIILRQLDLKRVIAYSSVIHMNFILLGLLVFIKSSLIGSTFLLISHGLVSPALFICIGILYERYHTRIILYYKSLVTIMPIYIFFFFFFMLANASLPSTSNFVGEFLVLLGVFEYNKIIALIFVLSLFYSSIVNFWIYNKIAFGNIKYTLIKYNNDLNQREITILLVFLVLVLSLGLFPYTLFVYFKNVLFTCIYV